MSWLMSDLRGGEGCNDYQTTPLSDAKAARWISIAVIPTINKRINKQGNGSPIAKHLHFDRVWEECVHSEPTVCVRVEHELEVVHILQSL